MTSVLGSDTPLGLAEFGLDRYLPQWVQTDFSDTVLDLGPGSKSIPQPNVTRLEWPEWDAEDRFSLIRYGSETINGVFAVNILEHLHDPRHLIREIARVLKPGCPANIFVPHARSVMYLQDLDHKTPFILDTWKNFLNPHLYYEKDHSQLGLSIGANFLFAVKEDNVGIVTQLIKAESL